MNCLKLNEQVNVERLNQLIQLDDLDISEKKQLIQYRKLITKGKVPVLYKPTSHGLGRLYAEKSLSLQNFSKKIRHTLAHDLYYDVDMVNAHPILLEQLCKKNGWNHSALSDYNNHREERLKDIMTTCNVVRSDAKTLILILLYLGEVSTWLSDIKNNTIPPTWVYELQIEFKQIAENLWNKEVDIVKVVKQSRKKELNNKKSSVMSIKLQIIENDILMKMFEWFNVNGFQVDVLVFDGLMVSKQKTLLDNHLHDCEDFICSTTGFSIRLETKTMDEIYDLNKEIVDIEDWEPEKKYTNYFNQQYCASIGGVDYIQYAKKKKYIELFLCKIQTPQVCYIFQNGLDRTPHIYSLSDINQLLQPIMSGYVSSTSNIPIPFMDKWKIDPEQHCKRVYDFIPYNPDIEKLNTDVYNLFIGYNEHIHDPYEISERDKIVFPFISILKEICGGEDNCLDFQLKYFASMIQQPSKRPPVMFIWIDKQGSGKNVILDTLGRLIGDEYYITSSNPKDFFGDYAEGFYRKLLVNLNECEGKDTFDFEGRIKSFITEDKIMVNPKFVRPTYVSNHAHPIATTNKTNPIPIDVRSKDRRYVVFRGTGKYISKPRSWWKKAVEHFKSPTFISALYDYLMSIDISNVNWDKDRPITQAYMEMARRYAPIEALFMEFFICNKQWLCYGENVCNVDVDEYDENDDNDIVYYEEKGYTAEQKIKSSDLYSSYKDFCQQNGYYKRDCPDVKSFNAKLSSDLHMPMQYKKSHGFNKWIFKPCEVISYMTERKWIMVDDNDIKNEIYLDSHTDSGENGEGDNDGFMKDFGF